MISKNVIFNLVLIGCIVHQTVKPSAVALDQRKAKIAALKAKANDLFAEAYTDSQVPTLSEQESSKTIEQAWEKIESYEKIIAKLNAGVRLVEIQADMAALSSTSGAESKALVSVTPADATRSLLAVQNGTPTTTDIVTTISSVAVTSKALQKSPEISPFLLITSALKLMMMQHGPAVKATIVNKQRVSEFVGRHEILLNQVIDAGMISFSQSGGAAVSTGALVSSGNAVGRKQSLSLSDKKSFEELFLGLYQNAGGLQSAIMQALTQYFSEAKPKLASQQNADLKKLGFVDDELSVVKAITAGAVSLAQQIADAPVVLADAKTKKIIAKNILVFDPRAGLYFLTPSAEAAVLQHFITLGLSQSQQDQAAKALVSVLGGSKAQLLLQDKPVRVEDVVYEISDEANSTFDDENIVRRGSRNTDVAGMGSEKLPDLIEMVAELVKNQDEQIHSLYLQVGPKLVAQKAKKVEKVTKMLDLIVAVEQAQSSSQKTVQKDVAVVVQISKMLDLIVAAQQAQSSWQQTSQISKKWVLKSSQDDANGQLTKILELLPVAAQSQKTSSRVLIRQNVTNSLTSARR